MVRALTVLLFTLAAPALAGALEERLAACQENFSDCREDCTTSYGTSFKLREQLGRCLDKCTRKKDDCRGRHIELDQAHIDEDGYERKRPGQELADEPTRREVPAAPAPRRPAPRPAPRQEARTEPEGERAAESAAEPTGQPAPDEPSPGARPGTDGTDRSERTEAREEPAARATGKPASPASTASAEDAQSAEPETPAAPAEDEAAREGAKKLMKRGIEEWDPSAEE